MVEIPCWAVAELDDCVRGRYSSSRSSFSDAKPRRIQSSTAVTDALLEQISENLSGLDELYLTGCQKVTHEGLVNALRYNKNGIRYLRVGDISSSFVRYHAPLSYCT